jgi:two-component system nitrate/nitrite response regulator NarL
MEEQIINQPKPDTKTANQLSQRELEVLHCLKKGFFYREIGRELHIAEETVKCHLKNIYHKLEVRNKTEALNKIFG